MASVGIKELKSHLSDYIARAQAGERIVVTIGGESVVEMPRSGEETALLDKLRAKGQVRWSGRKPQFPEKGLVVEGEPISETVLRDRR